MTCCVVRSAAGCNDFCPGRIDSIASAASLTLYIIFFLGARSEDEDEDEEGAEDEDEEEEGAEDEDEEEEEEEEDMVLLFNILITYFNL